MAVQPKQDGAKVTTGEVRLSYCYLLHPRPADDENDKEKYGCTLLVPKSDKATIAAIEAAQEVAKEDLKKQNGGKMPKTWKNTFRDGDEEKDLDDSPEYEGMMFMSVSSNNKPGVIDIAKNRLTDLDDVYSGMYARVSIKAAAFDYNGTKGVTFYLNNVQKLRDGENLTGYIAAEDDFDDDVDASDLL